MWKNKHKVKTQKYKININLLIKSASHKINHHSNLLLSVILLLINEQYRKKIKGKKRKRQTKKTRKITLITPPSFTFHFERNINQ